MLSRIFTLAMSLDKADSNPCVPVKKFKLDNERYRYLAPDEEAAIMEKLIDKPAHLRTEGYAPASMRRKVVVLKVFCSYWVRMGVLKESPFWRVKLSFGRIEQLPRALTEDEMRELLVQAGESRSAAEVPRKGSALAKSMERWASCRSYRALRNLALIDLLFATGMRVGEASALDIEDFSVAESVFYS
jgi:site-specific recombinase XerD